MKENVKECQWWYMRDVLTQETKEIGGLLLM
jgi:hypothetical protein